MYVGEYSLRCKCDRCGAYQEWTTPIRGTFDDARAMAVKDGWVLAGRDQATCPKCTTPQQRGSQHRAHPVR